MSVVESAPSKVNDSAYQNRFLADWNNFLPPASKGDTKVMFSVVSFCSWGGVVWSHYIIEWGHLVLPSYAQMHPGAPYPPPNISWARDSNKSLALSQCIMGYETPTSFNAWTNHDRGHRWLVFDWKPFLYFTSSGQTVQPSDIMINCSEFFRVIRPWII